MCYRQTAQRVNRYSIWIQTRTSGGLILFQNGRSNILGDYLALAVVGGKVELSYNLGKQTEEDLHIIRSSVAVDDGRWHHVIAVRYAGVLKACKKILYSRNNCV